MSREARRRAERLLGRAGGVRPGTRAAREVLADVEHELDRLRSLGYRELPDGSWASPDGRVIRR